MTTITREPTQGRFLADTADHEMTVLHDDGLYRHIRFKKPGTGMYRYDLITWPGHLTIAGDMGTWTFARTEDMLEFFRGNPDHPRINLDYWAEKLQAGAGSDGIDHIAYEWSEGAYRKQVEQYVADYVEGWALTDWDATGLRERVQEELLNKSSWDYPGAHSESAREALRDFEHKLRDADRTFRFEDTYEWNLREPTYQFTWCCWAIVYGIQIYRAPTGQTQQHST